MRLVVVASVASVLLAGCTAPLPAEEQLSITIRDVGKTPYEFVMPLWLHDQGPNVTAWLDTEPIKSGQVTRFQLTETGRGTGVLIAGNGTVTLSFEDVRSTGGGRFEDGGFTMGASPQGLPYLLVVEGDVDVVWFHEGVSASCFVTGTYQWLADGPGWHAARPGGRISYSQDCPT